MIEKFLSHKLFPAVFTMFSFLLYFLNELIFMSEIGRGVLAFFIIFLVPGYAVVRGIYKVPLLEEFVLSATISISENIICLTFLNMIFSVPITRDTVIGVYVVLTAIGLFVTYKRPFVR